MAPKKRGKKISFTSSRARWFWIFPFSPLDFQLKFWHYVPVLSFYRLKTFLLFLVEFTAVISDLRVLDLKLYQSYTSFVFLDIHDGCLAGTKVCRLSERLETRPTFEDGSWPLTSVAPNLAACLLQERQIAKSKFSCSKSSGYNVLLSLNFWQFLFHYIQRK